MVSGTTFASALFFAVIGLEMTSSEDVKLNYIAIIIYYGVECLGAFKATSWAGVLPAEVATSLTPPHRDIPTCRAL